MKRVVHQLIHTLSYGDAISGEALALKRCFEEMGCESEIFAINVHNKYKGIARKYQELPRDFSGEVILHYSLGSPLNELYRTLRATRSMIFHNLTPPEWFKGVNPRIVESIEAGVKELPGLCAITDRLIADSAFNAGELRKLGFSAEVLPLTVDPARWSEPANQGIAQLIQSEEGMHLVTVGRLAPNKCVEDVIKIFFFLNKYIDKKSRLWIVGVDTDTEIYSFSLKRLVGELNLEKSVNFVGQFADSELRALYENGSAYISMSEHEGFCVPLIEAMHFRMPVIAYGSSAVPETVGDGGVVVYEKRHAEIAELVAELVTNRSRRDSLISAGQSRVEELDYANFQRNVRALINLEEAVQTKKRRKMPENTQC